MTLFSNTENSYGWVAIFFHWLMAILVIGMLCLGLYMVELPRGPEKLKLIGWHKEIGFTILLLIILRSSWMLDNIKPQLSDLPSWERWSAKSVHWLLYLFMFLMPLTGWLMTSAAGFKISFFGWFLIPSIMPENEWAKNFLADLHSWLAFILIGLVVLHILAALKHQFIDRDNILRRMLFPID